MLRDRKISLVEVGPRDGLQSQAKSLPVEARVRLISLLAASGLSRIEVGAFVSERLVPQMAGSGQVLQLTQRMTRARLSVLTPGLDGFKKALASGAREIAVLTAASEGFCRANLRCSIDESLIRAASIIGEAKDNNISVRGYVSCAFGGRREGGGSTEQVNEIANELRRLGCHEISLCDTIGGASAQDVCDVVEDVAKDTPLTMLAGHFHGQRRQALLNIWTCIELGMSIFDCSVAGLGGCPFAPSTAGNVPTEDVVSMLRRSGLETGVKLDRLQVARAYVLHALSGAPEPGIAKAPSAARG